MLRMMVARSPGRASWAKNATVAAPHSTTSEEPIVRAMGRAGARPRRGRRGGGPRGGGGGEVPGAATVASVFASVLLAVSSVGAPLEKAGLLDETGLLD